MNFFTGIKEVFTTKDYIMSLLSGLKTTAILTLGAVAIGMVLGILVAAAKIIAKQNKKFRFLGTICDVYVAIVRGTPVALQLFLMAFAIFAIRGFPLEITAILTFGINSGAYISENFRAGIQSVDPGQTEAGRALGLSYGSTMARIVLPQAIKNVIPSIGNEVIALLKETSIVSMVGLIDLTYSAKIVGAGQNMASYLIPMSVAALFYLVIVYLLTLLIKLVERKFAQSERRK